MVLRCAGTFKIRLESGPVTVDMTTTVIHLYNSMRKDFKPFSHSLVYFSTYNTPTDLEIVDYTMNEKCHEIIIIKM